jgi:hypothetical protein
MRRYEIALAEALDNCEVRKFALWDRIVGGFKGLRRGIGWGEGGRRWEEAANIGRATKEMSKNRGQFGAEIDNLRTIKPPPAPEVVGKDREIVYKQRGKDIADLHNRAKEATFQQELSRRAGSKGPNVVTEHQKNVALAKGAKEAKDWRNVAMGAGIAAPVLGGGLYMAGKNGYFNNSATNRKGRGRSRRMA